ncbi:uncharacterized protein LOC103375745 [Stegastes partitus]|uniref:Uncharacterized protein LOC103375745 n=1 Tax=Stegastes partitus TaxID=144197 RepID=A0A9Y4U3T8_9TELE|nr:PREDICTED: uncharacterized protein LOC103375745 [Stegastes partitus]
MSLCVHSCWGVSSGTLVVIQSPDVSVMEGQTVDITCCWTEKFERATVHWWKNETRIKIRIFLNKSQGSLKSDTNNCSSLSFPNIRRSDSGRYICRVFMEIPYCVFIKGRGTLITVMDLESSDYVDSDHHNADDAPLAEVYIYILRCLPILILITPHCCLFFYFRKKAQQNTPASSRNNPRSVQRQEEGEEAEESVTQAARD